MDANSTLSTQEETELRDQVRSLKNDLATLRHDIRGLAGDLVNTGKLSATEAREKIEHGVSRAADATSETTRKAASYVEDEVRNRPYASLGVAALAGFVLGALVLRRRD